MNPLAQPIDRRPVTPIEFTKQPHRGIHHMKTLLTLCALLIMASPAWAQQTVFQTSECTELAWNPVVSEPLKEYRIHMLKDNVDQPPIIVPPDQAILPDGQVHFPCSALGFEVGFRYDVDVRAVDLSNNESGPSNVLPLMFVSADTTPPGSPNQFCYFGIDAFGATFIRCPAAQ